MQVQRRMSKARTKKPNTIPWGLGWAARALFLAINFFLKFMFKTVTEYKAAPPYIYGIIWRIEVKGWKLTVILKL